MEWWDKFIVPKMYGLFGIELIEAGDLCAVRRCAFVDDDQVLYAFERVKVKSVERGNTKRLENTRVTVESARGYDVVLDARQLVKLNPKQRKRWQFKATSETPFAFLTFAGGVMMIAGALICLGYPSSSTYRNFPFAYAALFGLCFAALGLGRLASGPRAGGYPKPVGIIFILIGIYGLLAFSSESYRSDLSSARVVFLIGVVIALVGIGATVLLYLVVSDRKVCPICDSMMNDKALKCRFCGSFLPVRRIVPRAAQAQRKPPRMFEGRWGKFGELLDKELFPRKRPKEATDDERRR